MVDIKKRINSMQRDSYLFFIGIWSLPGKGRDIFGKERRRYFCASPSQSVI